MGRKEAEIAVTENHGAICLKWNVGDGPKWKEITIRNGKLGKDFLGVWLLYHLSDLFNAMPLQQINAIIPKPLLEKHNKVFDRIFKLINNTNDAIETHENLKGVAKDWDRMLYWNVQEDMRYGSLFERLKRTLPDAICKNVKLGFDREKRKWVNSPPPMEIDELIEFIKENKIGRMASVNHYFLEKYWDHYSVHILQLFDWMGIDYYIMENDPPDMKPWGFPRRMFTGRGRTYLSNLHILTKDWDERYNNNGMHYIAIPQDYGSVSRQRELRDDYKVVVLSNSRWDGVQAMLRSIETIMRYMANPLTELTTWYMSMRRIFLNADELEYDRLAKISLLHNLFFMAAQWCKFEIVKNLNTDRTIEVYGDVGWKNVCPQYYMGSLNNAQIEELFAQDNILYLMLNFSYSYLDASGPVYDMIRRNVPWINVPPMARTKIFGKLKFIEYTNYDELNELVTDVRSAYRKALSGIRAYDYVLQCSADEVVRVLAGENNYKSEVFNNHLREHEWETNKNIDDYMNEREPFLRACYDMFKVKE